MDIVEFRYNHVLAEWPNYHLNENVDDICSKMNFMQPSSIIATYNPLPILMKLLIKISEMYLRWLRDEPSSAISENHVWKMYITVIREIILASKFKKFDFKDKANEEIVKLAEELKDLVYIGDVNDIRKKCKNIKGPQKNRINNLIYISEFARSHITGHSVRLNRAELEYYNLLSDLQVVLTAREIYFRNLEKDDPSQYHKLTRS